MYRVCRWLLGLKEEVNKHRHLLRRRWRLDLRPYNAMYICCATQTTCGRKVRRDKRGNIRNFTQTLYEGREIRIEQTHNGSRAKYSITNVMK